MRDSQRPAAEFNETAMRLWKAQAFAMVHHLATNHDAFTTDELWVLLADLPKPPEPRALGAVIRQAQDEKIIARSAMVVASTPRLRSRNERRRSRRRSA
jgi:hypothetical protein